MKNKSLYISFLLIFLIFGVYYPGMSSAFYYDDYANLKDLGNIQNIKDFWGFVFGGSAGPLGRPLSLLTFALQSNAWPEQGKSLFLINIFIHACNAVLIFYIVNKLFFINKNNLNESEKFEFGLIAAIFWSLSPILASSSLILIQRMTVLSAFFLFLTTLIYLHSFSVFREKLRIQFVFQIFLVGIGTALAGLAKENGLLIPSLIFCLEITILNNYREAKSFRRLRKFIFGSSLVVFVLYLSPLFTNWFEVDEYRQFSAWQRLQGELIILWQYVNLTFFPKIAFFGPFQDHVFLDKNNWIVAGSAWAFFLGFAIFLRRKSPWISLGIFWFMVAHLLESSTILLEPYYEHRNYVPLFGIAVIFSSFAHFIIGVNKAFRLAIYGYILILGSILFVMTSLWGKPAEAADFWVETNLGSVRAVVHQVNLTLGKNKEDLLSGQNKINQLKDIYGALSIVDRAIENCRDCFELEVQAITLSCLIESPGQTVARLEKAKSTLKNYQKINFAAVEGTSNIGNLIAQGQCQAISYKELDALVVAMLEQKISETLSFIKPRLEYQRATLAYADGRFNDAKNIAIQAEKNYPNVQPVNDFLIDFYIDRGNPELAVEFMEKKLKSDVSDEMKSNLKEKLFSVKNTNY